MNLVAKEYVATRGDGVGMLILSEMAGAAKELPEAIIVNPNDRREIAAALKEALETPADEQQARNRLMQRRLRRYDVTRWARDFLSSLVGMREIQTPLESKLLSIDGTREILDQYRSSERRLLFLDYDGTLTPLVRHPAMAKPDRKVRELLRTLAAQPKNNVVIASGRERQTLQEWFGSLPLGLVAEHGAWIKFAGQDWQHPKPFNTDWKRDLLPILEIYADRLPGAFVEEKEDAVAWHFRMADPEQAELRAPELVDHMTHLTAKTDLQVVLGSKVVEIRRAGVDKGTAALNWLNDSDYDFIIGIGDDTTDEDLFKNMPASALTIRVGIAPTLARYAVSSSAEVIELLGVLTREAHLAGRLNVTGRQRG
jgi:trehalose 6-phosphate synthase/phosphatase